VLEAIRTSFEQRRFDHFAELFSENALLETPYALARSHSTFHGKREIAAHFVQVSTSPLEALIHVESVHMRVYNTTEPNTFVLEFSVTLTRKADNQVQTLNSSIAILTLEAGKIQHYKDFPNATGLASAAGALNSYLAALAK
jgi:ketosteroid isomerase-like protein